MSLAVGAVQLTVALQEPELAKAVLFVGHPEKVGLILSSTVTLKLQVGAPQVLVAVTITLVVPTEKEEPEALE